MEGEDGWRTVVVPAPWQAQSDDLRHRTGVAARPRANDVHDLLRDRGAIHTEALIGPARLICDTWRFIARRGDAWPRRRSSHELPGAAGTREEAWPAVADPLRR
jgi:hypothetical protein